MHRIPSGFVPRDARWLLLWYVNVFDGFREAVAVFEKSAFCINRGLEDWHGSLSLFDFTKPLGKGVTILVRHESEEEKARSERSPYL